MKDELLDDRADERIEAIEPRPHPTPCEECQAMLIDFPNTPILDLVLDDGAHNLVTAYMMPCGAVTFGNRYFDNPIALTGPFLDVRRRRGLQLSN